MADPTDRTSMDDLTQAVAPTATGVASDGLPLVRVRSAAEIRESLLAFLREHNVLLGPDGLLRAEQVGTTTVECPGCGGSGRTGRTIPGVPTEVCIANSPCDRCWPRKPNGERVFWDDGSAGSIEVPSFALRPLDPPEDTP